MDELLTPYQIAAEIGVSRALVQRAIERGTLPATRLFGTRWGVKRRDGIAWKNNPEYHKRGGFRRRPKNQEF